ncbi:MAG: DUF1552 domain-containing protein [Polyangiaceae bacterium]|nr:DUF1552 domain-containing protein [Polyangiaceae bacterium]MCB9605396.1 DUF1552 domain-containing protein [Polyangiaceae bacterium]
MRLSRRHFLGGAAATVALPFLPSLFGRSAHAGEPGTAKRFMAFYVPCGIHMQRWTPSTTGADYQLTPILEPLSAVKQKLLVLSGLGNAPLKPEGAGDHAAGTAGFLTCRHIAKTSGESIRNGISIDQVFANALAEQTRIPSLQLGIDGGGGIGDCDSGYSCAYARNISWASETQPLPKTTNPKVVFDSLFDGFDPNATAEAIARRRKFRSSVLDYVNQDANSLKNKLGKTDQRKLDEYLTGVRSLEQRVQDATELACDPIERPGDNYTFPEHVKLMLDLTVMAFQCDVTRVVSFMLGNAGSGRSYEFIGVSGAHHQISHHQDLQENFDKLTAIDIWEVTQLAYLLERLDAIDEGGRSILDNSAIFFSSEIEDGNSHSHFNMPIVLAGGLGGDLPTGRHIKYGNKEPVANLFLRLAQGMGVPQGSFGDDGTAPLDLG